MCPRWTSLDLGNLLESQLPASTCLFPSCPVKHKSGNLERPHNLISGSRSLSTHKSSMKRSKTGGITLCCWTWPCASTDYQNCGHDWKARLVSGAGCGWGPGPWSIPPPRRGATPSGSVRRPTMPCLCTHASIKCSQLLCWTMIAMEMTRLAGTSPSIVNLSHVSCLYCLWWACQPC